MWVIAFHPRDSRLFVGDSGGMVTVWDLPSRSPCGAFFAHEGGVRSIVFFPGARAAVPDAHPLSEPDGTFFRLGACLATGGRDQSVHIWDLLDSGWHLTRELRGLGDDVWSIAIGQNARTIAVCTPNPRNASVALESDETLAMPVRLIDGLTMSEVATLRFGKAEFYDLVFFDSGQRLAALTNAGCVVVWSVLDGSILREVPLGTGGGDMALSPDGRIIAITSSPWNRIRLLATPDLEEAGTIDLDESEFRLLAFLPDGSLSTIGKNWIDIVDVQRKASLCRMPRPEGWMVNAMACSSCGRWLAWASGGSDLFVCDLPSSASRRG